MKKILVFLLIMVLALVTATGAYAVSLSSIADSFNKDSDVVSVNENGAMTISASATSSGLTIDAVAPSQAYKFDYTLSGSVLTGHFEGDNAFGGVYYSFLLTDVIETLLGYEKGEYPRMLNRPEAADFTIEKDGIQLTDGNDGSFTFKIDVNKKATAVDLSKVIATVEELKEFDTYLSGDGSYSTSFGNIYVYKTGYSGDNEIYIGEAKKLGDGAYQSLLNVIEVIYSKDVRDEFAKEYPKLDGSKEFGAFKVEVDPDIQGDSFYSRILPWENHRFVKVTVDPSLWLKEKAKTAELKLMASRTKNGRTKVRFSAESQEFLQDLEWAGYQLDVYLYKTTKKNAKRSDYRYTIHKVMGSSDYYYFKKGVKDKVHYYTAKVKVKDFDGNTVCTIEKSNVTPGSAKWTGKTTA